MFYSLDAVIALILIIGMVTLFTTLSQTDVPVRNIATKSQDFVNSLSAISVGEAEYPLLKELIANGSIKERQKDSSILEYVSELWAENKSTLATQIIENISRYVFVNDIGVDVYLEDDLLYSRNASTNYSGATSTMTVTGVTENETIKGVSARSYLTGIANKLNSEFIFFGGFVGQGNISKIGAVLPDDANVSAVFFEGYMGRNFSLYLNGVNCANLTFVDSGLNSTLYNISSCKNNLLFGAENKFEMFTDTNSPNAYIGGGYIEIVYRTKEINDDSSFNHSIYNIPGIEGIVNLYSSLLVPGELKEMNISLHFDVNSSDINNESFFLSIGDTIIYENTSINGETSVFIDDSKISSLINYADLDHNTVPIRIGFENISHSIEQVTGNADVILVTDLSGSMNRCVDNNNACTQTSDCPGSDCRIVLAKRLAKEFANKLLNVTGNRLALVTYAAVGLEAHNLSTNESSLNSTIDGFSPGGGTCIGCGARVARLILQNQSSPTADRFIIMMTDGIGNLRTSDTIVNRTSCCTSGGYCPTNDMIASEDFSASTDFATWGSEGTGIFYEHSSTRCINDGNDDCLCVDDNAAGSEIISKQSSIDLSTCPNGAGRITFEKLYEEGWLESDDCFTVLFSGDGGATWGGETTIFCNDHPSDPRTFTIPDTYLTSNFRYRIKSYNFGGSGEVGCLDGISVSCENTCGNGLYYDGTCADWLDDTAKTRAINDSCYAHNQTNATIHSIGFGAGSMGCNYAEDFLDKIAGCGNGTKFASDNVTGLSEIYNSLAEQIVQSTRSSQIVIIGQAIRNTKLFDDSFISYSYTSNISDSNLGYITINKISDHFGTCTPTISIPNVEISKALVTSYSSKYWTDYLSVNGAEVFNLSQYSSDYKELGDPFIISVPVSNLNLGGNNDFVINIGDSPTNSSGCSPHSRLFYTILIPTSIPQSGVYKVAEGCKWTIEYEDNTLDTLNVPLTYLGSNTCSYTSSNIDFNEDDAIDKAVFDFFEILDIDDNHRIDIRLDKNKFNIETIEINEIPSLLGPSTFSVRMWK